MYMMAMTHTLTGYAVFYDNYFEEFVKYQTGSLECKQQPNIFNYIFFLAIMFYKYGVILSFPLISPHI